MKAIARARPDHSTPPVVIRIRPRVDSGGRTALSIPFVSKLDELLLTALHRWSITALRVALGMVFVWFGVLKIFGMSPVTTLIQETYTFLPIHPFLLILGAWEMLVGIGIILKRALRSVLILLGMHLAGTFVAIWLNPRHFFVQGFPLFLTGEGEFVVKNLGLIAAGLVIAGHEVRPLKKQHLYRVDSMITEEEVL
jgi:putative oxidoreductase